MFLDPSRPDLSVQPLPDYEVSLPDFTYDEIPDEPVITRIRPRPVVEEVAAHPLQAGERWYIQIGTFQETDNAQALRDLMHQAGYGVELNADPSHPGQERVWVGPYPSQKQAEQVLDGIRSKAPLQSAHDGWVTLAQ